MDRRDFLRLTGAASATLAVPAAVSQAFAQAKAEPWRSFEVITRVEVVKPAGTTRIWLPTPLTQDTPYQRAMGNQWSVEGGTVAQAVDERYGNGIVWAEFPAGVRPTAVLTSRFATRDVAVDLSRPGNAKPE
ncbi:MAG TPA: twin-arginine translocation signal domain-containing protein, partial [Usitatibacter sp.]|nr:twin-arginine translocation signal domain-containing protein [Usitatibacter sp.]